MNGAWFMALLYQHYVHCRTTAIGPVHPKKWASPDPIPRSTSAHRQRPRISVVGLLAQRASQAKSNRFTHRDMSQSLVCFFPELSSLGCSWDPKKPEFFNHFCEVSMTQKSGSSISSKDGKWLRSGFTRQNWFPNVHDILQ